ncbi:MAG: tetratricopeptide repeat protein [Myxococcota bacterium]
MSGRIGSAILACGLVAGALGCGGSDPSPAKPTLPVRETVEVTEREGPPPPPASAEVRRGEKLIAEGDPVAAQRVLEDALQAHSDDPRAHFDLGMAFEMQGKVPKAEHHYRQAVALSPDFGEALNNLGLLLLETERPDESIEVLRRAVDARADLADAWTNLALALEATGQRPEAVKAWRRAAELAPDDPSVRANHGLAELAIGQREEAKATLRAGLRVAEGNAAALQAIGNGLRRVGDFDRAVTAMRAAIEAKEAGATPALLAELALAEHAAGDRAGAEASLAEALELDPEYATAHYVLGSLLAGRGAYREAIEHLRTVLELEPEGPHAAAAEERLKAARRALEKK